MSDSNDHDKQQKPKPHTMTVDPLTDDSSSEDDELLLNPRPLSQHSKGTPTLSQQSRSSHASPDADTSPSPTPTSGLSQKLRDKADSRARCCAQIGIAKTLSDPSRLKFYMEKTVCTPCYIPMDVDLPHPSPAKKKRRSNSTTTTASIPRLEVVFLGVKHGCVGDTAKNVVMGRLQDYCGKPDDHPKRSFWSPSLVKLYLRGIKKQRGFQDDDLGPEYWCHVEERYLHYLLQGVLENERAAKEKAAKGDENETLSKEEESNSSDQEEEGESDGENEEPSTNQKMTRLNPSTSNAKNDSTPQGPSCPLRAGDVVVYFAPGRRKTKENLRESQIVKVFCGQDIALELLDGTTLDRDAQVRVKQRYLRQKLQEHHDTYMYDVKEYRLDEKMNDNFQRKDTIPDIRQIQKEILERELPAAN